MGDIYIDLSSGQVYLKQVQPTPPPLRAIPPPTGTTIHVAPGNNIQAAINSASTGDQIVLDAGLHTITVTINVNKSVTIAGQGIASTTVIIRH